MICLLVYATLYPPVSKNENEKAVAKVNGVNISSIQLYEAMAASGGEQMLDSLITTELVSQEGQKAGIQVTDADLKKNMKTQVLLKKILAPHVTVSEWGDFATLAKEKSVDTDHKAASTPTLDEIKQTLTDQKITTLSTTWLEQKKSESTVENYLTKGA